LVIQEFLEKKGGTSLFNNLPDSDIQVGTVGLELEITVYEGDVVVDLSTATGLNIVLRKPNGTVLIKTASFSTDGTDGEIYYKTITGDIDVNGMWRVQAHVVSPSFDVYSTVIPFVVNKNLA
jgi:DUF4097 and DUF4098 domain-containing protein YvlB